MAKVLLVEDDPLFRALLQQQLCEAEHHVQLAPSFEEMREALEGQEFQPDVIILDWILPDDYKHQAIWYVRNVPTTNQTPILVVTAAVELEQVRRHAREAAVVLSKSEPMDKMLEIVQCLAEAEPDDLALHLEGTTVRRMAFPYPSVVLSDVQAQLLRVLLELGHQSPGKCIPIEDLASRVIVFSEDEGNREIILRKRIHRLRVRLNPLGVRIKAVRRKGYRLVAG